VRGLLAVLGVIGIVLMVPLFVVALPVALIGRAILETVWRRQSEHVELDRSHETVLPRWSVWK
jgi:hypothetical protein